MNPTIGGSIYHDSHCDIQPLVQADSAFYFLWDSRMSHFSG